MDCSGSRQGPVESSCEHGNEPSDYIKYLEAVATQLATSVGARHSKVN
jgi:hypothetical protein